METLQIVAVAALVIGAYYLGGREWHSLYQQERRERERLMDDALMAHGAAPVSDAAVRRAARNLEDQMREHEELQEMFAQETGGDDTD